MVKQKERGGKGSNQYRQRGVSKNAGRTATIDKALSAAVTLSPSVADRRDNLIVNGAQAMYAGPNGSEAFAKLTDLKSSEDTIDKMTDIFTNDISDPLDQIDFVKSLMQSHFRATGERIYCYDLETQWDDSAKAQTIEDPDGFRQRQPYERPITEIAVFDGENMRVISVANEDEERAALHQLNQIMSQGNGIALSYNGCGFDNPYLETRSALLNVTLNAEMTTVPKQPDGYDPVGINGRRDITWNGEVRHVDVKDMDELRYLTDQLKGAKRAKPEIAARIAPIEAQRDAGEITSEEADGQIDKLVRKGCSSLKPRSHHMGYESIELDNYTDLPDMSAEERAEYAASDVWSTGMLYLAATLHLGGETDRPNRSRRPTSEAVAPQAKAHVK